MRSNCYLHGKRVIPRTTSAQSNTHKSVDHPIMPTDRRTPAKTVQTRSDYRNQFKYKLSMLNYGISK